MTHSMRAFVQVLAVASITCLLAAKAQAATCPPGQVEDFGGCSECRAGQFQTLDENQQAVCVDCPLMTFSDSGATKCQPCAPGTLTYYTGSSSCENCSVGFVPQFNNDTNYPSCEQCPDGTYTPRPGTAPCQACQGGSYISMSYDEMNCTKCPAGTAPHNTTHPDSCYSDAIDFCCPACEPGTFTATAGTLECQACPAGTFQPNSSATGCLPCPPGTYTNTTGNSACTPTDIGYYQDKSGQSMQVACPAGTVGLVSGGATQAAACFPYSTGRYSFTERQDRLSVLTIRSFGTNAAVQSLGRDATRVMDSGTSSGCGGQVYSLETYYMCSRYPLVDGVLEKSVCTSEPTSGPLSSDCLTYSFYALTNGSFAWVIHANNSNTPTSTCLLHPGQTTTSCRFIEDVESSTYLAEYIYLGNVQQAAGQSTTNTQDIIAPGAQGSNSGGGSSSSSNSTKNSASLASAWASLRTLLPATALGAALLLHTL